jgi:hypothetical protein
MAKRTEQINIRLSDGDFEVLEAAAFVHRLTPSALLTEVAEEAVVEFRREPTTDAALNARRAADTGVEGSVSPIAAGRTARRKRK